MSRKKPREKAPVVMPAPAALAFARLIGRLMAEQLEKFDRRGERP